MLTSIVTQTHEKFFVEFKAHTCKWKQFVHNRVTEIRAHVPPINWRHCPGIQNFADIPSKGLTSTAMPQKIELWLHGPVNLERLVSEHVQDPPEECIAKLKKRGMQLATIHLITPSTLHEILPCMQSQEAA